MGVEFHKAGLIVIRANSKRSTTAENTYALPALRSLPQYSRYAGPLLDVRRTGLNGKDFFEDTGVD